MIIKNNDQIEEIKYLIPPVLNMYGVSEEQNEKVLKKVFALNATKKLFKISSFQSYPFRCLSTLDT